MTYQLRIGIFFPLIPGIVVYGRCYISYYFEFSTFVDVELFGAFLYVKSAIFGVNLVFSPNAGKYRPE